MYTSSSTASVADTIVPANNAAVPTAPSTTENTAPSAPAAPTAN